MPWHAAGSSHPRAQIVVSAPAVQPAGKPTTLGELLPHTVDSIPSSGKGPWSTDGNTKALFTGSPMSRTIGAPVVCSQWWSSVLIALAGDSAVPLNDSPHWFIGKPAGAMPVPAPPDT